jgi:hypothetical protein
MDSVGVRKVGTMAKDSKPTFFEWVGLAALMVLLVVGLILLLRQSTVNECVAGGYAAHRTVKGEPLCIGVNSGDGEWHVETWDSVRERLGER